MTPNARAILDGSFEAQAGRMAKRTGRMWFVLCYLRGSAGRRWLHDSNDPLPESTAIDYVAFPERRV